MVYLWVTYGCIYNILIFEFLPPLFGWNLQAPSESCKTQSLLASLLFLTSITSTFHIWTCIYLGLQFSLALIFLSSLTQGTSGLVSPCIMDPALCESSRQKDRQPGSMFYYNCNKIIVSSQHPQSHPWHKKLIQCIPIHRIETYICNHILGVLQIW